MKRRSYSNVQFQQLEFRPKLVHGSKTDRKTHILDGILEQGRIVREPSQFIDEFVSRNDSEPLIQEGNFE